MFYTIFFKFSPKKRLSSPSQNCIGGIRASLSAPDQKVKLPTSRILVTQVLILPNALVRLIESVCLRNGCVVHLMGRAASFP